MSPAARLPAAELALGRGMVSLSPLPGRGGDLRRDLADLKAWGADLLVTLVEPQELPLGFQSAVTEAALDWVCCAIPDYGVPQTPSVTAALPEFLQRLAAGQRIAFHCMGGCGRSGMMVLRLMVLFGEPSDQALARLRAHRPCAVETEAQLRWAHGDEGAV